MMALPRTMAPLSLRRAHQALPPFGHSPHPLALSLLSRSFHVSPSRKVGGYTEPPSAQQKVLNAQNLNDPVVKQRLQRPVAPHLGIYRPQITWYLSGLNRVTGVMVAGSLYLFGIGYALSSFTGWNLSSSALALSFATLPFAAKLLIKGTAAMPLMLHSFNGVRHLIWDTTMMLSNKQVIVSGWTVVGLASVAATYLTFAT